MISIVLQPADWPAREEVSCETRLSRGRVRERVGHTGGCCCCFLHVHYFPDYKPRLIQRCGISESYSSPARVPALQPIISCSEDPGRSDDNPAPGRDAPAAGRGGCECFRAATLAAAKRRQWTLRHSELLEILRLNMRHQIWPRLAF